MKISYPENAQELPGPDTVVIRLDGRVFSILAVELFLYPDAENVTEDYNNKIAPCLEYGKRGRVMSPLLEK